MRYKRFTITNFKGAQDIQLDLDRLPRSPVFALVGLNESGKTTILEAIHWLYSPTNYDHTDLIPKNKLANFNGKIWVEAEIALSEDDQNEVSRLLGAGRGKFTLHKPIESILIRRTYEYRNSEKVREGRSYGIDIIGKSSQMKDVRRLSTKDTRWQKVREHLESSLIPPIIYYENFLFDFPDRIYLEAKEGHELSREDKIYRNVIQDVLNSIDTTIMIESHIVERHKSGGRAVRSLESVLLKLAAKMTSDVFTIWKDLLKIDIAGRMEITLGQKVLEDVKGYYLEVKVKEGDQSFLIRERSLGFRWFFAFFLFTHFRAFRYPQQKKALFLLDEPASNLHPSAQTKLLGVLEGFPNKQDVIYATHSHHMINPKWLAGTFVVENETMGYSDVDVAYHSQLTRITAERYFKFVASRPDDTDYFRPILDSLDYQLSNLEYAPELVILEGKNDYYTLRYMKDLGYVRSSVGEHLCPSAGKDKVDYLIGLYLGWGRNFVVLLDDNSGGRQTCKRLKKTFGPVLDNRVFRLVAVNKEWKGYTMERLFASTDYPQVTKTVYPEQEGFDKSKFNIALQDCLINERKVKLHTYTISRFQKLFDFLEAKLDENRNQAAPQSK